MLTAMDDVAQQQWQPHGQHMATVYSSTEGCSPYHLIAFITQSICYVSSKLLVIKLLSVSTLF